MSDQLPTHQHWDQFWGQGKAGAGKVSWSKLRIIALLNPHIKAGIRVMDAGCGSGFFSAYFDAQGCDVVAVDYSDQALALTNKLTDGDVETRKADLLSTDFPASFSCPFDLIFSDGLFEHFSAEDQDRIMQNFKALLAAEGRVVTVVPNRWSPWQLIRPFLMPGIQEDPLTLAGLKDLNVRNGLKIEQQGGLNVLPVSLSPDRLLGPYVGMLLYTVAGKRLQSGGSPE